MPIHARGALERGASRMLRAMPLVVLLALALWLAVPSPALSAARAARWIWPVRGNVVTPFHLTANPFARGGHRGIDIAASAGAAVRAACGGRVTFAGRVGDRGRVVSVACGPLVATYLELGAVAVRRGQRIAAGRRIGSVAASHLQLGARRASDRSGYVDPLALLGGDPAPPPGPVPGGRPARGPRGAPARPSAPRPAAEPARPPARATAPDAGATPAAVWAGLALLAAGTPCGALWRRSRRARRASGAPSAAAALRPPS